jgi:predicted site-specific integrase-resolvase
MIEPIITETEAVNYLAKAGLEVQLQTMRAWRHRGKGPAYLKPAGKIRYRTSDLDLFVETSRVVPGESKRRKRRAA